MEINASLQSTSIDKIGPEAKRLITEIDAVFDKFNKRAFHNDALNVPEIMSITFSVLSIVTSRQVANHAFALAKTGMTESDDAQLLRFCDHLHEATWRNAQARFDDMMKDAA